MSLRSFFSFASLKKKYIFNFADTGAEELKHGSSRRGFLEEYLEKFHEQHLANCEYLLLAHRNLP